MPGIYESTRAMLKAAKDANDAEREYLLRRRILESSRGHNPATVRALQRGVNDAWNKFTLAQQRLYAECEHEFHFVEDARRQLLTDLERLDSGWKGDGKSGER